MRKIHVKRKKNRIGHYGYLAAYKSCLIIRGLVERGGAEVQVVITPAGRSLSLHHPSALTHKPVVSKFSRSAMEPGIGT